MKIMCVGEKKEKEKKRGNILMVEKDLIDLAKKKFFFFFPFIPFFDYHIYVILLCEIELQTTSYMIIDKLNKFYLYYLNITVLIKRWD